MLRAILMVAALSATTVHAEEYCPMTGGTAPIPEPVIGMEYRHIKPIMVEWGWEPVPGEHPFGGVNGAEQWALDNGFPEMDGCAGSVEACSYAWRDEIGNDMRIVTGYFTTGLEAQKVEALQLICRDTNDQVVHVFSK
jgi:hypothetical protein